MAVSALVPRRPRFGIPMGAPSHEQHEVIPTFIDPIHKVVHTKFMESDGKTVMTGSFGVTKAAKAGNAENLLVITHAAELAQRDTTNGKDHLSQTVPYQERN
jgi:phosphatidylserine/phosphatidylglycerophosphate/cardiolipin synthase-like enzyme